VGAITGIGKKGTAHDSVETMSCGPGRIRTCDPLLRRQVLYPLSYEPNLKQILNPNIYFLNKFKSPKFKTTIFRAFEYWSFEFV
jgi:hypothetical protein